MPTSILYFYVSVQWLFIQWSLIPRISNAYTYIVLLCKCSMIVVHTRLSYSYSIQCLSPIVYFLSVFNVCCSLQSSLFLEYPMPKPTVYFYVSVHCLFTRLPYSYSIQCLTYCVLLCLYVSVQCLLFFTKLPFFLSIQCLHLYCTFM